MAYCPAMVSDFSELAHRLAPDEDFMNVGTQAKHSIFKHLNQGLTEFDLKIGRFRVGGSTAKGTAISYVDKNNCNVYPDIDLIAFVNNKKPPFDEELRAFVTLLERHPDVQNTSRGSDYSVQFQFITAMGPINFDLLPAPNFVKSPAKGVNMGNQQAATAIRFLTKEHAKDYKTGGQLNRHKNKMFNSCFAESTVSLIQDHVKDPYILLVVRLAKYWMHQIRLDSKMSSKSFVTEILAIHAQRKGNKRSLIAGFRRFLELMSNFSSLLVSLNGKVLTCFKDARPVIIDPLNLYNNLTSHISKDVVETLEDQARKTLTVIESLRKAKDYESVENAMVDIFNHKCA